VVDEPRLVVAGDQAGEEGGVERGVHPSSMVAARRHYLK
jgi:hypothetical protein